MISYDEALELTLSSARRTQPEVRPLAEAVGRVLASDIVAPFPMPRFDNSAVDGYAVSEPTGTSVWGVVRTIGAGESPGAPLNPGECARIFTGAPTPPDTFGVVMQEDADQVAGRIRVCDEVQSGQHIRRQGEEFKAGETVLSAGSFLNPAGVAVAVSLGIKDVSIYRAPIVGIVVTGSELAAAGTELAPGQIYESNSQGLTAALSSLGLKPAFVEVVVDDPTATTEVLQDALNRCDVLITSGGVSVGDRDVVRDSLRSFGVQEVYWRVAIKPGKPVYFGQLGEKAVFGLPGNPMSVLATFTLLVQPFLKAMMGFPNPSPSRIQARLQNPLTHHPGRREFVPANLCTTSEGVGVAPILNQGSHMLGGMARADVLIDVPAEVSLLSEGEPVWVIPFGKVGV